MNYGKEGDLEVELDVKEKIKEEIDRQKKLLEKSAVNMSQVPEHLRTYQGKAFELMQKELRALEDRAKQ